jgi:2-keto-4-pentenoate hydratase/2-oxohepta-3-ene-1,7-dioic acid hydratase in catechol pathway
MRIVVYGPQKRVGAWEDSEIIDLQGATAKYLREQLGEARPYQMASALVPETLRAFIDGRERTLENARKAVQYFQKAGDRRGVEGEQLAYSANSVKLHPPIPNPNSPIACMGANYIAHGEAGRHRRGDFRPDGEVLEELRKGGLGTGGSVGGFWKLTDTIRGHGDDVMYPSRTKRMDYEGEIAIVIGKPAKNVPASRVNEYIWGVTAHVDWSIRDGDDNGNRTFRHAKNFDNSSSLGPSIVVGELDPQNHDMETRVNGEVRQRYNSQGMTFSFAEIIEFLSSNFTLVPGFIISGGCGPGTAMEIGKPEAFLKPGDVVEFESPRIGLLRNHIVSEHA